MSLLLRIFLYLFVFLLLFFAKRMEIGFPKKKEKVLNWIPWPSANRI
uniref:Uncharacterized protein n=1 Tax=Setaria italica TaxID=4555 RepID=K3Z2F6_SETIT